MTWVADDDGHARVLDESNAQDHDLVVRLRADPGIEVIDNWQRQVESAQQLTPGLDIDASAGPTHWVYYPWRRAVVAVLDPPSFRRVRLDRNRNMVTAAEQEAFGDLRIGVVGLSVGHAVAHTIATQGLCGELRLADFDELELTNLNRVPATVFDIGLNKAIVAARRISELDPYLPLQVVTSGLTESSVDEFLDGLDIVVEECDSLDMKVIVREAARARRIPVLMATSDRGLVDVERFDLEPDRPILHGLLGAVDTASLSTLASQDKVPHVLRILDASRLSARGAASLIEVGQTLATWPQLAGDVMLGATAIAEAVRRIGLGEQLPSGRVRVDVSSALDQLSEPAQSTEHPSESEFTDPIILETRIDDHSNVIDRMAAAAVRAPSAGNVQPWQLEKQRDAVTIRLAAEHTSTVDIGFRASAVAVGAAAYNARIAAAGAAHADVELKNGDEKSPLHALVRLSEGSDPELAELYRPMLLRETNRRHGDTRPVDAEAIQHLESVAEQQGARLRFLHRRNEIDEAAEILAATDRIRYLTPRLHEEMFAELRLPDDPDPDSGIDVRSLELDARDLITIDILRRPEVMAHLAQWDTGTALGADTRDRVRASAALAVITVTGHTLVDYARGGSALEAVWIHAHQRGYAVQPVSPLFLYAHTLEELRGLSDPYAGLLGRLQHTFRELAGTAAGESQIIVLRLCRAQPASVRSRRRRG